MLRDVSLAERDPEIFNLIKKERERQRVGIELIASENFVSQSVLECLGSCLTNKYSEGLPGARYYGGNEHIDAIERVCIQRALNAFQLDPKEWAINVQCYSGSPANLEAYTALLRPHDRVMGLGLPHGGHLTHGFYTAKTRVSATSIFFESLPYGVDPATGEIDFPELRRLAKIFLPKMIIAGTSAYSRILDYKKFREICDDVGCILLADMAHIAGLVAAGLHPSPFELCDAVTTTTHKTLRGPRSAVIFMSKKRLGAEIEEKMNSAVFPSLQGGPHNHQIAAMATQFLEVATQEWKDYSAAVIRNAKALARGLMKRGQTVVAGGTDVHLLLWDMRPLGLTGSKFEKAAEFVNLSLNKNAIPGDSSAMNPSGIRIGTPAMTTRGCNEEQFDKIADILVRLANICVEIQKTSGKKLTEFCKYFEANGQLLELRAEVIDFASPLYLPGY